ncbi:MAG: Coenzyme F420 hydrogenase/dehydrogenase, beta subunit C-terminal domain [Selenomonadaceae bacterium]|nr:Coenzyme F420 hydrogenase/dehydrogenase, beta subunit C-terminal domain [Selenomonadaceae bacterium]
MKIEEMIAANRADCSGCEACANICPKNAITMIRDAEGFAYPKIDSELCIQCGRCDATCPALNFTKKTVTELPPTFTAIYDNDKILRHSSSGGMFTALSEIVLRNGGVVFGAGFDKNWHVLHTSARTIDELENLRGSKYVQSQIGDVYRQVKEALKSTSVLFSGVPCQCAGLKHFLGKDYDNLLTVEIICHGVPSPALWERYIGEVVNAHEITHVNFRSKRTGWISTMDIIFADQGHIIIANAKHLYGKLFLKGISERPSCQACKFKFPNTQSDLIIGDAWGIKDFAPETYDKRGVSIVFINTAKGKNFFEQAKLKTNPIKFVDALKKNPRVISPTFADSRREKFFADLAADKDWVSVMQKYYSQDDEKTTKEKNKQQGALYKKNLQEILSPIRQQFAQNVLIVASVRDNDGQKLLVKFFEHNLKNCNVYFLQPKDEGQFVCKENFSGFNFDLKDTVALTDFIKKYNLEGIFVEKPLDFGESSTVIVDWLKNCGLPVKLFKVKTN